MDQALYIAMNGAAQLLQGQTVHLNNLANSSTTGFRSDYEQVSSYYLNQNKLDSVVYSKVEQPGSNLSHGTIIQSGNDLDIAIDGEGWLAVSLPSGGEGYTRAGELHVDSSGVLKTEKDYPVLGNGGPISLPPFEEIEIGVDGTINIRPTGQSATSLASVDRIKLVNPLPSEIRKGTDGLFITKNGELLEPDAAVKVRQRAYESSNVNAVEEMTNIISIV